LSLVRRENKRRGSDVLNADEFEGNRYSWAQM